MTVMTSDEMQDALYQLGPWLIGAFGDILFQGVLFCQFAHYVEWHWEDKIFVRLQVLVLALLTTLKSIHCFATIWILFVLHFADIEGALLLNYSAWWEKGNPIMVATIGAFVQAYFCNRLFVVSKNNWFVVTPIAIVLLFSYISVCVMTHYISSGGSSAGSHIGTWNACHLGAVFAGDLLITLCTAYFLLKTKKDVLPQTVGVIKALIRLSIQTSAPASLCAMLNLIFVVTQTVQTDGSQKSISTGFNLVLPKLYAFSMMWTLNARHSIRNASSGGRYTSDNSSGRPTRRDNVELKTYNGTNIQVHTHIETVQQIDVHFDDEGDGTKTHNEDDFKTTSAV